MPPGRDKPGKVGLLLRNLYGSVWAPKLFSTRLYNWFHVNGFEPNAHDPCIYSRWESQGPLEVVAHVDDLGAVGTRPQVDRFYKQLTDPKEGFAITRHGALGADGKIFRDPYNKNGVGAVRYLGVECQRTKREFILKNSTLIQNLIQKAKPYMHNTHKQHVPMTDCRLSDVDAVKEPKHRKEKGLDQKPFRSFLGACGYICMATKPQCSYAFKELARFNTNFGLPHWEALLNLISYIQTTQDEGLIIPAAGGEDITAYSDADWNGSDKHLSTTGWIIFCGDAPISWCSQMQRATARSVCESEYISLSHLSQELVYIQMLSGSLDMPNDYVAVKVNSGSDEPWQAGKDPSSALRAWRAYTSSEGLSKHGDPPTTKTTAYTDSANAEANARTPFGWLSNKLRHIKTAFHCVKDAILPNDTGTRIRLEEVGSKPPSGQFGLEHVRGDDNPSDCLTKGMGAPNVKGTNQKAELFNRHAKFCLGYRSI